MNAAFTPGPWKLIPCPCGNQHCQRQQLENVGTFYMGTGFEPADANLIAAAPDLYEALVLATAYLSDLPHESAHKIASAIAKARGEPA